MGSVSDVRALVSAAVDAVAGWTPSRFAPELFGRDTDQLSDHSFAVAVPATEDHARDGRQRVAEGLLVVSTVEVSWACRLRGDAQSADYSSALDAEQELVSAVKAISTAHVLALSMTRRSLAEGWVVGQATFRVVHRYALT